MAAAVDLEQAAKQAWDNLTTLSVAGTLRAKLLVFCTTIKASFEEAKPGDHPMLNWIAVLHAYATTMSAIASDWPALRPAAEYVYRLCFMGQQSKNQALITNAQYTVVLNTYNAQF